MLEWTVEWDDKKRLEVEWSGVEVVESQTKFSTSTS